MKTFHWYVFVSLFFSNWWESKGWSKFKEKLVENNLLLTFVYRKSDVHQYPSMHLRLPVCLHLIHLPWPALHLYRFKLLEIIPPLGLLLLWPTCNSLLLPCHQHLQGPHQEGLSHHHQCPVGLCHLEWDPLDFHTKCLDLHHINMACLLGCHQGLEWWTTIKASHWWAHLCKALEDHHHHHMAHHQGGHPDYLDRTQAVGHLWDYPWVHLGDSRLHWTEMLVECPL